MSCNFQTPPEDMRNSYMVREYHVIVLQVNHVSVFCMGLYVSGGFHVKYTYMINLEYNHVVLSDHASLSKRSYS